jgi:hypothetical protein
MKNRFLMLAALLFLAGCTIQQPISSVTPKNNRSYEVEYLFEHDGCRVYRFQDGTTWVYFTNCRGEAISYPDSTTVIRNSTNLKPKNR